MATTESTESTEIMAAIRPPRHQERIRTAAMRTMDSTRPLIPRLAEVQGENLRIMSAVLQGLLLMNIKSNNVIADRIRQVRLIMTLPT